MNENYCFPYLENSTPKKLSSSTDQHPNMNPPYKELTHFYIKKDPTNRDIKSYKSHFRELLSDSDNIKSTIHNSDKKLDEIQKSYKKISAHEKEPFQFPKFEHEFTWRDNHHEQQTQIKSMETSKHNTTSDIGNYKGKDTTRTAHLSQLEKGSISKKFYKEHKIFFNSSCFFLGVLSILPFSLVMISQDRISKVFGREKIFGGLP